MKILEKPNRRTVQQYVTLCCTGRGVMPTRKHRIAVSLEDSEFSELAEMASKYDVSFGWLGRQAVLDFIARYRDAQLQLPLPLKVRRLHERRPDDHV
jgi:hypothetical protein